MKPEVSMYCTETCRFCNAAEALLRNKGVQDINKIYIDLDPGGRDALEEKTGRRTVPQIFVGDYHVGGYDDLSALDREGRLDPLLAGS